MRSPRPLRVLLMANDGLGAGHVTRSIAVAQGLERRAAARGTRVELLLATTSEADPLIGSTEIPCVRWPTPGRAREGGWTDAARRELGAGVLRGVLEGFRPDLLVTDTFPLGPHGELTGLVAEVPRRALIRRSVRPERAMDSLLRSGLSDYDLAILPDDPQEHRPETLPIPWVRVPPITLLEAAQAHPREAARKCLGLPLEGSVLLVGAGGGGDPEAMGCAINICQSIERLAPGILPVLALGPLLRQSPGTEGLRITRECPLQPWLAAFDGAIAPAGYNLAHELAKARLPLALFSMSRPYDDQSTRAARFEGAGLARALPDLSDQHLRSALDWMKHGSCPGIPAGGADAAAEALLRLVMGPSQPLTESAR